jgi:hypothetical protein
MQMKNEIALLKIKNKNKKQTRKKKQEKRNKKKETRKKKQEKRNSFKMKFKTNLKFNFDSIFLTENNNHVIEQIHLTITR